MISSYDYYKQIESPNMYLCNPDRRFICALNGDNRHLVLRFNDLSELTFTVPKLKDTETYYNLIESKRLVFIEKIGWFQIVDVSEKTEGESSTKDVTAQSHQYSFKDRGFVTEERLYMFYNPNDPLDEKYDSRNIAAIPSVVGQLYKQLGVKVSLNNADIEPTEDKGDWTIIYIDPILKFRSKSYGEMYVAADYIDNVCRGFEAKDDLNGYDFMINQVEKAFEVIFEFDFLHHTIKVKTLDDITKPTNIYLAFDNLVTALNIKESAEDIVTVMSCNGSDIDIRTVNPMGTNYIANFDYYKKRISDDGKIEYPWMSKELIDALDAWEVEFEKWQHDDSSRTGHTKSYSTLVKELQELYVQKTQADADIQYANLKLTDMQVARDQFINGDDKTLEGEGYVTAETVDVGKKSLLSASTFYGTNFTDAVTIIGHTTAAKPTKGEDGRYTFAFSDAGVSGTPKSLIQNFIDSKGDEDNATVAWYFMDSDSRSYCKLNVASEVGVVKDSDGNISSSGTVEVRGVVFNVVNVNSAFAITFPNGTSITASQSNSYFIYDGARYRILASADGIVSVYAFYVSGFERYTTYAETVGNNGWCSIWENHINHTLTPISDNLQSDIKAIEKGEMAYINTQCDIQEFIKRCGQALYDELSNYWIEGDYSNSNIATYDTTTMSERIDLAKELMNAGKVDLAKCSQPQFEMTVDALNFIKMYEFRQFTNELVLGRIITIEKCEGVCFRPALMTIEYDLDVSDSFTMTFSNASKPGDTSMTFADLLKETSSAARTVSANWSNLTDYTRNKEKLTNMINAPLDRTLRAAQADMAAQAFIIDDTGILGRKYDSAADASNSTFLPEQIRIINNTILFTDDNWESASLALGKIYLGDNGETAYGLVADVLVGNLMVSKEMRIFNDAGSIYLDENGITVKNTDGVATFRAYPDGSISILGYATTASQDELAEDLRQEFTIADSQLKSTIEQTLKNYSTTTEMRSEIAQSANEITLLVSETLKDYSTTTEMQSAIEQSAQSITLSVSETLKNYSTTTEMQSAIDIASGAITAEVKEIYAPKGDGDTSFSYVLTASNFTLSSNGSEVFRCDKDGIYVRGTGEFSGTIYATAGGTIGGFTIGSNYISSGDGGLTINQNGLVIAQQLEVRDYFKANSLQIGRISGRYDNSAYLDFEQSGTQQHEVVASCAYVVTDEGSDGFFTAGWKPGSVTVTISTNVKLLASKTFTVTLSYLSSTKGHTTTEYASISAGSSSVSIEVANKTRRGALEAVETLYKVTISPTNYWENSGVSLRSVGCNGSLIPATKDSEHQLGSSDYLWSQVWAQNSTIQTSDRQHKHDIAALDEKYSEFFDRLEPVTYKMNNGTSGRKHIGFIANSIKESLDALGIDSKDFAGYCEWVNDSGEKSCGLRYEEFIALSIHEIQRIKQRLLQIEEYISRKE